MKTMKTASNHLFTGNATIEQLEGTLQPDYGLTHSEVAHNLIALCYSIRKWGDEHSPEIAVNKSQDTSLCGLIIQPTGVRKLDEGWQYVIGFAFCYTGHLQSRLYHGISPPDEHAIPMGKILLPRSGNSQRKYPLLPQLHEALNTFVEETKSYTQRLYQLQHWVMSRRELTFLITNAANDRLIPWSRVGKVYETIHERELYNFWEVLQAFSQVARMSPPVNTNPPTNHMDQVNTFREWIEKIGKG